MPTTQWETEIERETANAHRRQFKTFVRKLYRMLCNFLILFQYNEAAVAVAATTAATNGRKRTHETAHHIHTPMYRPNTERRKIKKKNTKWKNISILLPVQHHFHMCGACTLCRPACLPASSKSMSIPMFVVVIVIVVTVATHCYNDDFMLGTTIIVKILKKYS